MTPILAPPADAWSAYADDPLPGWGRASGTLFDVRPAALADAPPADVGVLSVPFDTTSSTRAGSRDGPRAIREASLAYSSQAQSRGDVALVHMRTGERVRARPLEVVDYGDQHVYPSDPERQMAATAAETRRAASRAERLVMLGGEHTLSYAWFCGVAAAREAAGGGALGYVQIDRHFDFGATSVLHGPYYQGSNARRISEHPAMARSRLGFVGVGDLTSAAQYEDLLRSGVHVRTIGAVRREGFEPSLRAVLDGVAKEASALYVSIDIDVCDMSVAPGTGHVTVGGLSAAEFMSIAWVLKDYPVAALDIVEVAPALDPSGRTAFLAARFLFEWLYLERAGR